MSGRVAMVGGWRLQEIRLNEVLHNHHIAPLAVKSAVLVVDTDFTKAEVAHQRAAGG